MKKLMAALLAVVLVLSAIGYPAAGAEEGAEHPVVRIALRDDGYIYAELYPEYAPVTVDNFLNLTKEGFYDGLTFHRIIAGFMIQGGDPLGNGTGGSAHQIKGEFSRNGVDNPLKHTRGVLSMARSSDMDSASSQFFIMHADAAHLDGAYAAFGRVLSGIPAVDRICMLTPVQDNNGTVLSVDQPVIESIRVVDAEEARAAMDVEEANGRAGTVYQDPFTSLSFQVPEGWNRTAYPSSCTSLFEPEKASGEQLSIYSIDVWGRFSDALTKMGFTRETFDLDAMIQVGLLTLDLTRLTREEHSGTVFYTIRQGAEVLYIAARNGNLYQFAFTSAGEETPVSPAILAILDHLT